MSIENQNIAMKETETLTIDGLETLTTSVPNIHTVVQTIDGLPAIWSFKSKKELAKALTENPSVKVLGTFKGKKLTLQEKKSYTFC